MKKAHGNLNPIGYTFPRKVEKSATMYKWCNYECHRQHLACLATDYPDKSQSKFSAHLIEDFFRKCEKSEKMQWLCLIMLINHPPWYLEE